MRGQAPATWRQRRATRGVPPVSGPDQHVVEELIGRILDRFHDTHRRELPVIVGLASEVEAHGLTPGLAEALQGLAEALDQHMFKEEARLFPMMQQGGNNLIEALMDDMHSEHLAHAALLRDLEARVSGASAPAGAEEAARALQAAWRKLTDDLAEHVRLEDEVLFPLFRAGRRA